MKKILVLAFFLFALAGCPKRTVPDGTAPDDAGADAGIDVVSMAG